MEPTIRRGGRRKGTGKYGIPVSGYFSQEEKDELEALAAHWRCSLAEALRRAVRDTVKREKVTAVQK